MHLDSEFYIAQKTMLERVKKLPHRDIEWTLGDGGDTQNHPSYGHVMMSTPDGEDKDLKVPKVIHKVFSSDARLYNDGWLFKMPVNPTNGVFYTPPGTEEIPSAQLEQFLRGADIASLPQYQPSGAEVLARLKSHSGARYFARPVAVE